jgi:sigma-E factor negative regulatory protein RseC
MSETGIVKEYDPTTNLLTIEFNAHGTCKSCGMCLIGNGHDHSMMQLKAMNTLNAKPGDTVEFEVKEGEMLKASMLLYGFPLAMLLLGFIFGKWIAALLSLSQDFSAIIGASSFFCLAFYILSLRDRGIKSNYEHIRLINILAK